MKPKKQTMHVLGVVSDQEAIAAATPEEMSRLFFISNFEGTDPKSPAPGQHGYQRQPLTERIPKIADYYSKAESRITPILVSCRVELDDVDDFVDAWNAGDIDAIKARWGDSVVSVVDGQHRYLGLVRRWQTDPEFNPLVPIVLNFGMSFIEEAEFFDVINATQKKLPKALIEITKADATRAGEISHEQRIRLVATMLARHDDSVWKGKVNLTGARDPNKPVTYEGLRRSSVAMFPQQLLDRLEGVGLDPDEVARDYWRAVANACSDAWNDVPLIEIDPETGDSREVPQPYRLKELVGVASLARLGKDIIAAALEHPDFKAKMAERVAKLHAVDWVKGSGNPWMASQAGFAGQADLYAVLYRWVFNDKSPTDD